MKNRRENSGNMVTTIILGTITILALTVCIIFICLYMKTLKDYKESTSNAANEPVESIDFNASDEEEIMGQQATEPITDSANAETSVSDSASTVQANGTDELSVQVPNADMDETEGLFSTFDNQEFFSQVDQSTLGKVKNKMQEIVTMQDAGPITMIRYFFPEKLIFYDNNSYVFADILENVAKHSYLASNFHVDDAGEITYAEDGNTTSHKVIDVSKYQGTIDWTAVAADQVEYAFVRLGIRGYQSGAMVLDDTFADNMMNAQNAGIKTGAYFFTQAINEAEAVEEAEFVIENLEGYDVACPVVFDVEMITDGNGRANNLTKEERTAVCIAFCEKIKEAGYTPMIYGNIKCFVNMIDLEQLENYEKWFAFYDTYLYCPYQVSMWQYTEKGSVDGIKGKVDLNVCFQEW